MSLPIVLRPIAQAEYDYAVAWYESQQAGLGLDFAAEVERILDRIKVQPDRYPLAFRDLREAPLSRFPYCIYYRVKPDRIVVVAVFHSTRDPSVWQSRA